MANAHATLDAPLPPVGTRVRVHLNRHNGRWSVTVKGRIVAHASSVAIDCERVHANPKGVERVRTGKREVCLWAVGTIAPMPDGAGVPVRFTPRGTHAATMPDGSPYTGGGILAFHAGASQPTLS
jgi:hypothetical protein